jgi:aromatic-L-amino-acid decarboxylase
LKDEKAVTKAEPAGIAPPLGDMSPEEFRRFGHEVVDWIANYLSRTEDYPVLAQVEPGQLRSQLPPTPPERGEPMSEHVCLRARNFR